MEIRENTAWKSLKRNLESSVDKLLSKHENINDATEISTKVFESIVEDISNSKEINDVTRTFLEYNELSENGKNFLMEQLDKPDLYDESKLENICYHLSQSNSADNRIKALELLLKYPATDIIDKYKWPKLSKLLRECLINRNREIYLNSYKIHVKLSIHSQGILEATGNLLKTLNMIFHSKRICAFITCIDLKNITQEEIIKSMNLLLNNFRIIFKNYNTNKEKSTDNLILDFLNLLISFKDYDRSDYIHSLYYIFVLDPRAKWFKQFMHSMTTRKIVINFLYKNPVLLKYFIKEIITNINNEKEPTSKKLWKNEIPLDIIKVTALQHSCNILSILLSYKWGQKLFPVEIKSSDTNLPTLIIIIINATIHLSNLPKFNYKRDILIETLKSILINNRHLLYNKDIIHALVKPFLFKLHEKQRLADIARKNIHVLQIVNAVCSTLDSFYIIFGFSDVNVKKHKNRHQHYIRSVSLQEPYVMSTFIEKYTKHHFTITEQNNVSIARIIIDFTTNVVRYHVNTFEKMSFVNDVVYDLLETCCAIHQLHTHTILLVNSQKLLQACLDFYKVLIDHNLIINTMNSLLKFFVIICETRFGTDLFLKEDTDLFYILCKHYFFIFDNTLNNQKDFFIFFVNLSNTVPGCIAITECKKQIISPFFNKIWKIDEDEFIYLSGNDKLMQKECFKYNRFIFSLQLNFNCVQALLSNDTDDDSTLVDTEDKPITIKDLIEDTMNNSGPGTSSCYLGLQTIKILLNNLDVLILLETMADLKEQVKILQTECSSEVEVKQPQTDISIIIDECSELRQNILDYIQNIGYVKCNTQKTKSQLKLQSIAASSKKLHEFQRFLNDSRNNLHDNNWILQARRIFKQSCIINFKELTFVDLMQQARLFYPVNKNYFTWPENDQLPELFTEDIVGINIIIRFGKSNKILQSSNQYEEILTLLLKQVQKYLNIKRDKFEGFDWFVGIIFLMCAGNIERCKTVLQNFVNFPSSPYIWSALGMQLGYIRNVDYSIHLDHTLNKIIEDLEIFKPALEAAGISWNFIVKNWLNQCFFNVLPWSEIYNFLMFAVLFPVEYTIFFIVCCAQHLERKFLDAISNNNITYYENILQLSGFHIGDYFICLDQLAKQYKHVLFK